MSEQVLPATTSADLTIWEFFYFLFLLPPRSWAQSHRGSHNAVWTGPRLRRRCERGSLPIHTGAWIASPNLLSSTRREPFYFAFIAFLFRCHLVLPGSHFCMPAMASALPIRWPTSVPLDLELACSLFFICLLSCRVNSTSFCRCLALGKSFSCFEGPSQLSWLIWLWFCNNREEESVVVWGRVRRRWGWTYLNGQLVVSYF